MKIKFVILARTVWLFDLNLLNPQGRSIQGVLEKLGPQYRFATSPRNPLDLDENKSLAFKLGTFTNSKAVSVGVSFNIYNNGVSAETSSSTDDCTEFLLDVRSRLKSEFGLVIPDEEVKTAYVSQLMVESDASLSALNPQIPKFIRLIESRVKRVDGTPSRFDVGAFNLWTEDVNQLMAPAMFRFERKHGTPFSSNDYFSQAPLQTQEHIDVLDALGQILSGKM